MAPVTAAVGGVLALLGLLLIGWVHPPGRQNDGAAPSPNAVQAVTVFFEYVPLSLVLLLLVEVSFPNRIAVAGLGIALLTSRLCHAKALRRSTRHTRLRLFASRLNWVFLLIAAIILLYTSFMSLGGQGRLLSHRTDQPNIERE